MDGKKKWVWVLPLYIAMLPKMLWHRMFPPKPSAMAELLQREQERALEQRNKEK